MSARPARIVDAHVHLWNPARTDWYPYLGGQLDIGMGDVSTMARRFDVATYRAEAGGWNVEKLVNVAAATGEHSIDETLAMAERADADGQPAALVGGLPPGDTVTDVIEAIDRQAAVSRLRGVRPMGSPVGWVPPVEVLDALHQRGLIFELLARPTHLAEAARRLAASDDLTVVVEHTGWPASDTADERAVWEDGMRALASVGPNVHCKLSGIVGGLGSMDARTLAPWIETAIELFGADRCFFASNFPVDGMHGTLDQLWSAYAEVTAGEDEATVDALFATNAERLYRI